MSSKPQCSSEMMDHHYPQETVAVIHAVFREDVQHTGLHTNATLGNFMLVVMFSISKIDDNCLEAMEVTMALAAVTSAYHRIETSGRCTMTAACLSSSYCCLSCMGIFNGTSPQYLVQVLRRDQPLQAFSSCSAVSCFVTTASSILLSSTLFALCTASTSSANLLFAWPDLQAGRSHSKM